MAYDKTTFLSGLTMGLIGKGNPTFEGSGKMLYNGVALPALPVWDKIKYPYVCMVRYFEDTTVGYSTQVFMSAEPPIYDYAAFQRTAKIPTPYLTCSNDRDYVTPTAWTNLTESTSGDFIVSTMYDIAWSNVDILKDDGTVYVAASDPVPVEDVFSKGYHVGAELRKKRVLPVAYLYNGVRLPDINSVWTDELKAEYPYAVIHAGIGIYGFYLVLLDMPLRQDPNNFGFESNNSNFRRYGGNRASEEWTLEISGTGYAPVAKAMWANYDVYNVDGTIHITASEPIPVYE